MSRDWDYAKMVKEASAAGGPVDWINTIKEANYNKGASDMKEKLVIPLLVAGVGIGSIGTVGYQRISKWISDKKAKKVLAEKEVVQVEKRFIEELDSSIRKNEKREM